MSYLPVVDADFERRWTAWQERSRVHDRMINGRLRIALPLVACIAAVGAYLLLGR